MHFVIVKESGGVLRYARTDFRLKERELYVRSDGKEVVVLRWGFDCRTCGAASELVTGLSYGRFVPYCKTCLAADRTAAGLRRRDAAREREIDSVPDCWAVYDAAARLYPRQLSIAVNAPRRINAAMLLREADIRLVSHTLAEIRAGVEMAIARGFVKWSVVGQRTRSADGKRPGNRAALTGLWPRPEWALNKLGLVRSGALS